MSYASVCSHYVAIINFQITIFDKAHIVGETGKKTTRSSTQHWHFVPGLLLAKEGVLNMYVDEFYYTTSLKILFYRIVE